MQFFELERKLLGLGLLFVVQESQNGELGASLSYIMTHYSVFFTYCFHFCNRFLNAFRVFILLKFCLNRNGIKVDFQEEDGF